MSYFAFANLKDGHLDQIKALESKLGTPLVALRPVDLTPAPLDKTALEEVQALEKELGLALVAVKH